MLQEIFSTTFLDADFNFLDLNGIQEAAKHKLIGGKKPQIDKIGRAAGIYLCIPNAPQHVTQDYLQLYFESNKSSGGLASSVNNVNIKRVKDDVYVTVHIDNQSGK